MADASPLPCAGSLLLLCMLQCKDPHSLTACLLADKQKIIQKQMVAQAARALRLQGSAWLSTRAAMPLLRDCDLFLLDQSGQHDALAWALRRPLKHWQDIVDCLLGDALSREQPGIEADLAQQSSH